ncbi:hypothetical protein GCM10025868_44640 [Angustibacter aerolatus]|uniref:DUF456 domain-containing protein n=1 Tax=Angustibacter aerolatus TaxID=1162965 RepID=A0ABQ6JPF5_9ACTN|nr:hypothetical protein [Angustibacter aerolatus]GMA89214.1 hypothetical protein GCM10025868_44640 [Angustibacter aerolatus]
MTGAVDVLVGVVILIGLVGVVVPVLPGLVLVLAALLIWAIEQGTPSAGSSSASVPRSSPWARWSSTCSPGGD